MLYICIYALYVILTYNAYIIISYYHIIWNTGTNFKNLNKKTMVQYFTSSFFSSLKYPQRQNSVDDGGTAVRADKSSLSQQ